jgi:virginiamycin B lyase
LGFAVDGQRIYWSNSGNGTIGEANLDNPGSPNQSFITGANEPPGGGRRRQNIYWASYFSGTIGRANLDGTGANQAFIPAADTNFAYVVAVSVSITSINTAAARRSRARHRNR